EDGEAARPPGRTDARQGEDLVDGDRLQSLDLYPEVGNGVADVGPEPLNFGLARVHPANGGHRNDPQLDVLRAAVEVAVDVPRVDGRNRPLHRLHVLLRNTPSPSPQNGYSMGRV